jgi:hypothetical protein
VFTIALLSLAAYLSWLRRGSLEQARP